MPEDLRNLGKHFGDAGFDSTTHKSIETAQSNTTEKNMIPKYNTTDDAPNDAGLYIAEDEGRLAYKEVN